MLVCRKGRSWAYVLQTVEGPSVLCVAQVGPFDTCSEHAVLCHTDCILLKLLFNPIETKDV